MKSYNSPPAHPLSNKRLRLKLPIWTYTNIFNDDDTNYNLISHVLLHDYYCLTVIIERARLLPTDSCRSINHQVPALDCDGLWLMAGQPDWWCSQPSDGFCSTAQKRALLLNYLGPANVEN